MFFSKTIKKWKESKMKKEELALLEEKKEAWSDTISTAVLGFILGIVGTVLLSGIFYIMISTSHELLTDSSDTMSAFFTLTIGYSFPIYLAVLLGIIKTSFTTFNSLWIFLKFIFVKVENYDLANKPNFRV